jgi:hypothetical protein
LQSQAAIANAAILIATQSLSNANNTYQNFIIPVISNFRTCILQGGTFFAPVFAISCTAQLGNNATRNIFSAFTTAMQNFYQALGLSANSARAAVTPLATSTLQSFQTTVQGATNSVVAAMTPLANSTLQSFQTILQASTNQAATISQQAETCISQAVKSTAVGANATATTAGANTTATTTATPSG